LTPALSVSVLGTVARGLLRRYIAVVPHGSPQPISTRFKSPQNKLFEIESPFWHKKNMGEKTRFPANSSRSVGRPEKLLLRNPQHPGQAFANFGARAFVAMQNHAQEFPADPAPLGGLANGNLALIQNFSCFQIHNVAILGVTVTVTSKF